jgi:hypothetical protein
MDKRLYFESLEELSHKDTWVHYYFEYYKTFVIFSFFFFLSMIPSLTLYKFKHLGVTFSSDAKLNIHIENILSSIYKHLNFLRKLKYKPQVATDQVY